MAKPPFIRSPYNYDVKAASDECSHDNFGESLTIQSMAADADINVLMHRMGVTGQMPEPMQKLPTWGDFTDVPDFRTAVEQVQHGREEFMKWPARIRAEFDNDPAKFIEACQNPENKDRLRSLGLLAPEKAPPPLTRDTEAIIEAVKASKGSTSSGTT